MTAPVAAGPMVPSRHRITARHPELDGVVTLELTPLDGAAVPARPGQFTMLWAFGVGEVPISYSGLPGASPAARHTIRAVGATTRALCDLPTGAVVGVRGPFGTSWPPTPRSSPSPPTSARCSRPRCTPV